MTSVLTIRRIDGEVPEVEPASREELAGLGFASVGAYVIRMPVEAELLDAAEGADRAAMERLDGGVVSEAWLAADRTVFADVSRYHQDLAWSLLTLLEDGTLIRSSSHSARDTAVGRLLNPVAAGYHRHDAVDVALTDLSARHAERVKHAAYGRRSAPVALVPEDYPRLEQRTAAIVDAISGRAAVVAALVVFVGMPVTLGAVVFGPWVGGYVDTVPAFALVGALLVGWLGWVMRPIAAVMTVVQLVGPRLAQPLVPATEVLGRPLSVW